MEKLNVKRCKLKVLVSLNKEDVLNKGFEMFRRRAIFADHHDQFPAKPLRHRNAPDYAPLLIDGQHAMDAIGNDGK
jgi:hypothetical protein